MGKHDKKTGKGRLDKFYKLAKEQGYRARSAFKLIHLNRKYDLLSKSKCVIDLCAAPGGWLQVAEKYMPKGGLIIGVDLAAIKPLPHVITFVSDITTPHCRTTLKSHMHDWKADLVLHDGAPNVGSAWVQDAFTQNELVLQSLRLAVEFLTKGGSFVTKVFRSQDYNSLMWVFGQLFKTVEATKPPSSRNVSAEIFVVCRDFIAPKHIDPKFLDPKHVFKDVSSLPTSITAPPTKGSEPAIQASTSAAATAAARAANSHAHSNVFAPEKKRRHREGYAEGDYTLFHTARAEEFVRGGDPVMVLGGMNRIDFVSDEEKGWLASRHTTPEVVANFADLKVLGKGDFKALMKWRLAIRLEIGLDVKTVPEVETTEDVTIAPMDEEEEISEELKRLHESQLAKARRERKRNNEKKARTLQRLQLNMTAPADLDNEDRALGGEEVFDLGEGEKEVSRRGGKRNLRDVVRDADGMSESESEHEDDETDNEIYSSDEERELKTQALEGALDGLYDEYKERMSDRDAKFKVKQARLRDKNFEKWGGIKEDSEDEEEKMIKDRIARVPRRGSADPEDEEDSEDGGWDVVAASKAKVGEDDSDTDSDSGQEQRSVKKSKSILKVTSKPAPKPKRGLVTSLQGNEQRAEMSRQAQLWFDQSVFKGLPDLADLDEEEDEDEDHKDDEADLSADESTAESREDVDEDALPEDAEIGSDIEMASTLSSTLEDEVVDEDDDDDDNDFEIVPADPEDDDKAWDVDDGDQDEVKRKYVQEKGLLTGEAITMASRLVNRQTNADKLIDEGFNRHANYKDGLPTWFLDDEAKHYKPNLPVTKEAMNILREKQRALDARPIKKVAEAKQRKKFKAHQRLEKAKKKADGLMEAPDMSERDKANQVVKLMGRAVNGKPKLPEKKLVVAKGVNRGVKGRPKGVKGRYKIVDARMRKEVRALKRVKKSTKKR